MRGLPRGSERISPPGPTCSSYPAQRTLPGGAGRHALSCLARPPRRRGATERSRAGTASATSASRVARRRPPTPVRFAGRLSARSAPGWGVAFRCGRAPPPPPPLSRTKWTRRVPHPVLIGHAASFDSVKVRERRLDPDELDEYHDWEVRPPPRGEASAFKDRKMRSLIKEGIEACRDHRREHPGAGRVRAPGAGEPTRAWRPAPPPPSRTNRTRLVPPSRTNRTRLVPPSRTNWTRLGIQWLCRPCRPRRGGHDG